MKKTAISLLALIFGTSVVLADSTEIVSLDEASQVIEGLDARISSNGRTIAFRPVPHLPDQYFARIREPEFAKTVRVTPNYLGTDWAPGFHSQVALSGNGRFAVFTSNGCDITASHQCVNVDPAPGVAPFNVYRRDLDLGVTKLVSKSVIDGSGNHLGGQTGDPLISDDGIWVAFESFATDLATADSWSHPGFRDVYLQNVENNSFTRLVSRYRQERCPVGTPAGHSWLGDMVPYGRFVVFVSNAPHLRDCVDDENYELFMWDNRNLVLHRTFQLVSPPDSIFDGQFPLEFAAHPSISDDAHYIAFVLDQRINVYDMHTQSTLFPHPQGPQGLYPLISGNGQKVAFQSSVPLVADDTNELIDVYVLDVATGEVELASRPPAGAGNGQSHLFYVTPDFDRPGAQISWDGRYIAFTSLASNLVPFDSNSNVDTFVRDILLGETRLASETPSGEAAVAANIQLDATGNLAVFQALSYVPEQPNHVTVVLRDMRRPTELIVDLKQDIVALNLRNGVSNSLDGKLIAVDQALSDARNNNDVAAIAALEAFIKEVDAQRGVNLTSEEADDLIAAAQTIIDLI